MGRMSKLCKNPPEAEPNAEVTVVQMATIFYEGKNLEISFNETHMPRAIVKLLKLMDELIGKCTVNGFPKPWREIDTVSGVGEYSAKDVVNLVANYNKVAKPYHATWAGSYNTENLKEWSGIHSSADIAEKITMVAYEMGVPRPTALNRHYQLWSAETYGETNLQQMASILNEVEIGLKDVFVDLGCGVGQIVAFVSAYSQCKKSVGIELSPLPYSCSEKLTMHYRKLMKFFGKRHGKFELHKGDIMDMKFRPLLLEEATVIFINNLVFPEELMLKIKDHILQNLKDGTRIITTKPLYNVKNQRVNPRRINDLVAISDSIKLASIRDGVSWTNSPVQFYKTTMRREKLQEYYESVHQEKVLAEEKKAKKRALALQKKQEAALNTSSAASPSSSSFSSSSSSSSSPPSSTLDDDSGVVVEEPVFAVPALKRSKHWGKSWSPKERKEDAEEAVFKVPEDPHVFKAPEDVAVFKAPEDTPIFKVPEDTPIFKAPEDPHVFKAPEDPHVFKIPALKIPADLVASGPLILEEDVDIQVHAKTSEPLLRRVTAEDVELLTKRSNICTALMELHKMENPNAVVEDSEGDVKDSVEDVKGSEEVQKENEASEGVVKTIHEEQQPEDTTF